ncbi:hypothetical protein quinque_003791 [Culex quinquefasciatus]
MYPRLNGSSLPGSTTHDLSTKMLPWFPRPILLRGSYVPAARAINYYYTATDPTTDHGRPKMLSRITRPTVSSNDYTRDYASTSLLPRLYGSTLPSNDTGCSHYDACSTLLSRPSLSKAGVNYASSALLPGIDRPAMPNNATADHNSATCTNNNTCSTLLPGID